MTETFLHRPERRRSPRSKSPIAPKPTPADPGAVLRTPAPADVGAAMYDLMETLYPICRSITGQGVRKTLAILGRCIPIEVTEIPTGRPVLDWTVPKEWNIRDAYIKDAAGRRVVDFRKSNLHVVSYSVPVRARMTLAQLRSHLHTLPEQPDWIPYRTSYYSEQWGFCLRHRDLLALEDGEYEVVIDSTLAPGHLTYGEYVLPGDSADEVLISCHVCHPSLANDNLSGIALAIELARTLAQRRQRRYTYRFLFVPGTIGSITWLALNPEAVKRIRHGLVAVCVGDAGGFFYKRSRRGDAEIDAAAEHVLAHSGQPFELIDFYPYGYDERQYCSPGFNLPVGSLSRSTHARYPEYHTSADDLAFVRPEHLAASLDIYTAVVDVLEGNRRYGNLSPYGEPQLGRRGLYRALGATTDRKTEEMALFWTLNQSDGSHTLLDIARRARLPFAHIRRAADALERAGLLAELNADG
jgi:aminopeptidase-like protein